MRYSGKYFHFLTIFAVLALSALNGLATDYTIGKPGGGATDFKTLELLRTSVAFLDGDTITIYGDDNSLQNAIDIAGNNVTIKGYGFITSVATTEAFINSGTSGSLNIQPDSGRTLEFSGFGEESVSYGGVFGSDTSIKFGTPGTTDTVAFSDNRAYDGGVIYANDVEFIDGNYTFFGNSVEANGGAICAHYFGSDPANLTFRNGSYVFSKNFAVRGGAINSDNDITFMDGDYTFSNNFGGHGGAINSSMLTFMDGNYTFSENFGEYGGGAIKIDYLLESFDGNYTFSNNSSEYGNGGAIYSSFSTTFHNGNYTFFNNHAMSDYAYGGAVYVTHFQTFYDGNYTFSNNSAGYGGAIYCDILAIHDGDYLFSGNSANIRGGAIYTANGLEFHGGNFTFTGNSASLGGAIYDQNLQISGGNSLFSGNTAWSNDEDWTGLGGAIYTRNSTITNATFLDNKAVRSDPTNPTSGRGGAVFVDPHYGGSTFDLIATSGNTVLFRGNMHGYESALTTNSIYFGTTLSYSNDGTTATFTAEEDGRILMYDPIESQADNVGSANTILNLTKDGTGLWLLAGESNLESKATISIDEGTFWLYRDASLNLNNAGQGYFEVDNGAVFRPTIHQNAVSTVHAESVWLKSGSQLELPGISTLARGDTTFVDAITSLHASINEMSALTPNSGNMFQEAKYIDGTGNNFDLAVSGIRNISDVFEEADPFIDVYRKHVLVDDEREMFDDIYLNGRLNDVFLSPEMQEFFALAPGQTILDTTNARRADAELLRRLVYDRLNDYELPRGSQDQDFLFRGRSYRNSCRKPGHLWGTYTQNWTDMGHSSYDPFAFTVGRDFQARHWMFGLAAQYVQGNVHDSGQLISTRVDSDSFDFGLYAGRYGRHWYGKGVLQFGFGRNDVETRYRDVGDLRLGGHADGSYNTATLGTGLEFGRNFQIGCPTHQLVLTPYAGADYFFLHAEAFDERGASNMRRSFGRVNYNVVELPFGLRIAKTYMRTGGVMNWLRPNVDLAYVRSVADRAPTTLARYFAIPTENWLASGTQLGRDVFRMNVSLDGRFWNRFDTGVSYQLETRDNFTSHQFKGAFSI